MKKPATLGLAGAKTRFDELQAIHQLQAYSTHFVVCVLGRIRQEVKTDLDISRAPSYPFIG